MRARVLILILVFIQGCFLAHGTGDGVDAGRRDAGGTEASDAASPTVGRDAGPVDPGPPAPPEPEPDPGPEGRPSDSPEAEDWEDPPDPGAGAPCCELGDPILITSRELGMSLQHEPPLIAWGSDGWRLAYSRFFDRGGEGMANRVVTAQLAPDGTVMSDPAIVATPLITDPMVAPLAQALRWRGGRWALVISAEHVGRNGREHYVRLYDRLLVPASDWLPLGPGVTADSAYLAHGDRWIGASGWDDGVMFRVFDERMGERVTSSIASELVTSVHVEGFASRAAALLPQLDGRGTSAQVVVLDAEGLPVGEVPLFLERQDQAAFGRVRDLAVVAVVEGGHAQVEIVDPFAMRLVGRPIELGEAFDPGLAGFGGAGAIDVAGSDKFGVAGVCWGVPGDDTGGRDGSPSQINFRLVGDDGRPLGTAVEIVSGPFRGNAVNCSVGSDGVGFLVGWWNGSELWVRRVDVPR